MKKLIDQSLQNISSDPKIFAELQHRLASLASGDQNRTLASVVLLFTGESNTEWSVLLTKRSSELSTHAGQIAFPGGAVDDSESSNTQVTAVRELYEECGVQLPLEAVIGKMPSFPTVTGNFLVDPWVAWLKEPSGLKINTEEVVQAEFVSCNSLYASLVWENINFRGNSQSHPVFYWHNHKVWGLTAWMFYLFMKGFQYEDKK